MSYQTPQSLSVSGLEWRKQQNSESDYDEIYHLLSSSRRRAALVHIAGADGPVRFESVHRFVSEAEFGTPWEELDSSERRTIHVSLQQTHIPTLVKADVVETDGRTTGLLELGPNADDVLSHLSEPDGGGIISGLLEGFF